jgi:hypothetical protein
LDLSTTALATSSAQPCTSEHRVLRSESFSAVVCADRRSSRVPARKLTAYGFSLSDLGHVCLASPRRSQREPKVTARRAQSLYSESLMPKPENPAQCLQGGDQQKARPSPVGLSLSARCVWVRGKANHDPPTCCRRLLLCLVAGTGFALFGSAQRSPPDPGDDSGNGRSRPPQASRGLCAA